MVGNPDTPPAEPLASMVIVASQPAALATLVEGTSADDRMTLSIPIPGDREVVTQATVRRRGEDEVALEFAQLDWDDMFALARFLHPRLP